MKVIEITVAEWNKILARDNTYFINGCAFDNDNLIAFGWYGGAEHGVGKYYKVEQ